MYPSLKTGTLTIHRFSRDSGQVPVVNFPCQTLSSSENLVGWCLENVIFFCPLLRREGGSLTSLYYGNNIVFHGRKSSNKNSRHLNMQSSLT